MRSALVALILTAGSLVAAEEKPFVCELFSTEESRSGTAYKLWISNVTKKDIEFCARKSSFGNIAPMRWNRTDTWVSSSPQVETRSGHPALHEYPAFYADVYDKDGKEQFAGDPLVRYAIQNPSGEEDSFCTLRPGQSLTCADPVFSAKPERAVFHFLVRRDGKMVSIQGEWNIEQSSSAVWEKVTGHPSPKGDPGRIKTYSTPGVVKEIQPGSLPVISETRPIYDFKPWCVENGLAAAEIDFAFYDPASGLCLISTGEANQLKLKELHFEPN